MKRLLTVFVIAICFATTNIACEPASNGSGEANFGLMILYASVAIVFSFLCSVAEAVVLSVTPSYIANMEKDGKKNARILKKVKQDIDRSLAAILTLNTIAHTVGAGGAGAQAGRHAGIAMVILTLLILFVSEIIPKTLGAVHWRRLAPWTARFIQALTWILYPLIFVSELLTRLLTRGASVHGFSRDEFTALADIGAKGGHLDPKESRILKNLFRFPDLCAGDIMTPRTVVFALQQDLTAHEALEAHPESRFSRIPIFGENRDDIAGFVLYSELLLDEHRNQGQAQLRDLKRDIRAVEDATRLSSVLEELLDHRAHILLVVDKYGGMQGIVTLEDVVETLIGIEIVDEADKIDDMRKLARQKWEERMQELGIDVRRDVEPEAEEQRDKGGEEQRD